MARTLDLNILTSQPDSTRDDEWEQAFFHAFADGKVVVPRSESQVGPDGWPYLYVQTSPNATEPVVRVLDWLSTRGIGLVVNGHKDVPDYIFPYGMVWNWKERSQFITPSQPVTSGAVELKAGQQILAGPPAPDYLPPYVRSILAQFLQGQGVTSAKVLMISHDHKHYDLAFSLESLGSPPDHEHRGIAEALAWFLPQHYSLMLVSEKGLPEFQALGAAKP
ncbi:MAG: hypothetical protein AB7N80_09635 [Bdellovibrionales bacterium]